jgi:hypothetical protein
MLCYIFVTYWLCFCSVQFASLMNGSVIMGPVFPGGFDVTDAKTAHQTILMKGTAVSITRM